MNLFEIHQNKNLFLRCLMVENSWAKSRKNFHTSHFPSNCEIFENRSKLIELNLSKHQIDLTRKNSWWWSPKFKIKQNNLFLNKNAAMNFWTSMSIGSNICITCITFAYASSWKTLANKRFSFAPSYGCIHVCISDKDFCIRHSMNKHLHLHLHLHLHPHEGHLHNKIFICTIIWLHSCLHIQ